MSCSEQTAGVAGCEQVLQLRSGPLMFHCPLFMCVSAHVSVWTAYPCVLVCACGHKCKHVCNINKSEQQCGAVRALLVRNLIAKDTEAQRQLSHSAPPLTLASVDTWTDPVTAFTCTHKTTFCEPLQEIWNIDKNKF